MFNGVEQKEYTAVMDGTSGRLQIAFDVDRLFRDYLLELSPGEATLFISQTYQSGMDANRKAESLLQRINDVIPPSVITKSGPWHIYRIGRRVNRRIIYLVLPGVHFQRRYRFSSLLKVLEKYAEEADALYQVRSDENDWEIMFWWV